VIFGNSPGVLKFEIFYPAIYRGTRSDVLRITGGKYWTKLGVRGARNHDSFPGRSKKISLLNEASRQEPRNDLKSRNNGKHFIWQ
jgi:hypothetical protein